MSGALRQRYAAACEEGNEGGVRPPRDRSVRERTWVALVGAAVANGA
jgi:hypothetical protein